MTPFERAKLRLMAFFMLEGWGEKDDGKNPEWRPWGMERRRERAMNMVEWAMAEDATEQKPE